MERERPAQAGNSVKLLICKICMNVTVHSMIHLCLFTTLKMSSNFQIKLVTFYLRLLFFFTFPSKETQTPKRVRVHRREGILTVGRDSLPGGSLPDLMWTRAGFNRQTAGQAQPRPNIPAQGPGTPLLSQHQVSL